MTIIQSNNSQQNNMASVSEYLDSTLKMGLEAQKQEHSKLLELINKKIQSIQELGDPVRREIQFQLKYPKLGDSPGSIYQELDVNTWEGRRETIQKRIEAINVLLDNPAPEIPANAFDQNPQQ